MKKLAYHHKKKKLLKRKGNSITPANTNAPIPQTSSERLKITNQTDQMKTKILIMKLGQLEEEITKVPLSINADLSNYFISIILETDQRKNYPSWGYFGEATKISTIFYK